MSRGGFKITRCGEQHEKPGRSNDSNVPSWMKGFASKADAIVASNEQSRKEAVTVVDKVRERNTPSIYEQMYSIMNGKKPIYSSVEEAVSDYQKKTGLTEHIKSVQSSASNTKEAAEHILRAAESVEDQKKNTEEPVVFVKAPHSKNFLEKLVRNQPSLSVPAILHILAESFEVDGVTDSDLDDPNLGYFINNLIIGNSTYQKDDSAYIADDLGLDMDPTNNNDVFEVLRPSSSNS